MYKNPKVFYVVIVKYDEAGRLVANASCTKYEAKDEETATRDRDIARRWTDGNLPVVKDKPKPSQDSSGLDDETLEKLQILYVSGLQNSFDTNTLDIFSEEPEGGESSSWAAQRSPQRESP
ncbi:hypothetical protein F66182_16857, partial [Fusarium sp. NRRL 66182]